MSAAHRDREWIRLGPLGKNMQAKGKGEEGTEAAQFQLPVVLYCILAFNFLHKIHQKSQIHEIKSHVR